MTFAIPTWSTLAAIVVAFAVAGLAFAQLFALGSVPTRRIGPYRVLRRLGEGGMGVVYEAFDSVHRRTVALKRMHDATDASLRIRFEHEIRALELIRHPNTVGFLDEGWTSRDGRYLVMELVDGVDLARVVAQGGAFTPHRAVAVVRELCDALAAVHDAGFVHRDVKLANVCLHVGADGSQRVKLVDFGLARQLGADAPDLSPDRLLGSPHAMAPECFTAPASAGPAADVYALGVVAYTLLAGRPPFTGNLVEVALQHLHTAPPPARGCRMLSTELQVLISSCLEKRPELRPTAREIRRALQDCPESASFAALTRRRAEVLQDRACLAA